MSARSRRRQILEKVQSSAFDRSLIRSKGTLSVLVYKLVWVCIHSPLGNTPSAPIKPRGEIAWAITIAQISHFFYLSRSKIAANCDRRKVFKRSLKMLAAAYPVLKARRRGGGPTFYVAHGNLVMAGRLRPNGLQVQDRAFNSPKPFFTDLQLRN